jgi:pyruvate dehydrogenase E2 component (dihydrolipoamide acetyltransferase)
VATPILMPQMGLEVTEGTVVEILVEVGATVAKDEPVIVLATDKADTDVGASAAGVVREIAVQPGDTVEIGATLLWITDTAAEPFDRDAPEGEPLPLSSVPAQSPVPSASPPTPALPRLRAAPVARRAATAHGIALETISGTGPRGRITLRDVERKAASPSAPVSPALACTPPLAAPRRAALPGGLQALTPMRRAIARRMTASQREIPQYQLVREVDATHLLAQKAAATAAVAGGPRPGINDLLVQAIAETLVRHPDVAAVYVDGDEPTLRRPSSIDVGLAVATEGGLLVPVLRRAHERPLRELAADRVRLVEQARAGTLPLNEMTGGTISLSNLGGFGIDRFTAMVNPGESAIVAVGRTVDRVVPRGRGTAILPVLTVTMAFDHRVVDGATGARALAELAQLLEGEMPWRI